MGAWLRTLRHQQWSRSLRATAGLARAHCNGSFACGSRSKCMARFLNPAGLTTNALLATVQHGRLCLNARQAVFRNSHRDSRPAGYCTSHRTHVSSLHCHCIIDA